MDLPGSNFSLETSCLNPKAFGAALLVETPKHHTSLNVLRRHLFLKRYFGFRPVFVETFAVLTYDSLACLILS